MRVDDAFLPYGEIGWDFNDTYNLAKAPPTVVLRNEDFSRIARLLADSPDVDLEFDIKNTAYPEGTAPGNAVAEIPGTDKRDSILVLGAHIDSCTSLREQQTTRWVRNHDGNCAHFAQTRPSPKANNSSGTFQW